MADILPFPSRAHVHAPAGEDVAPPSGSPYFIKVRNIENGVAWAVVICTASGEVWSCAGQFRTEAQADAYIEANDPADDPSWPGGAA